MKKPNYRILDIDPSIALKIDIEEIINTSLVKLQAYSTNDEVVLNIFEVLMTYLKKEHVDRIFSATFRKDKLQQIKRSYNLKKLLENDEEED